jgi:hypothetical protein
VSVRRDLGEANDMSGGGMLSVGVDEATRCSSVESVYSIVRSYLVAAVELLDIVVLVHAPRPLALTREHVRPTLNYLDCRAIVTACILCVCNGNTVDGLIGCCSML